MLTEGCRHERTELEHGLGARPGLGPWASAFLTSGSLLLGFYILLRDRRKEERREAEKVICWIEEVDALKQRYRPRVANFADRPVSALYLVIEMCDRENGNRVLKASTLAPFIRPGEEEAGTERTIAANKVKRVFVAFSDADGIEWAWDLRPDLSGLAVHPATLQSKRGWFKHSGSFRNVNVTVMRERGNDFRLTAAPHRRRLRWGAVAPSDQ
ncbi:hypothetical protein [Streptomyces sp. NPDC005046]